MLIEFRVGNYRSFKEVVTFSMVAADIVSPNKSLDENNVFAVDDDLKLLKTAAIYGANASGKSNFIDAFAFMLGFATSVSEVGEKIPVNPFKLSSETEEKPSFFEIIFLLKDGRKCQYGFEADSEKVVSEWLYSFENSRETVHFIRDNDEYEIDETDPANKLKEITRLDVLFLSVSAQFNIDIAKKIVAFFNKKINVISGIGYKKHSLPYTKKRLIENRNKEEIIRLIKKLDLGIQGVELVENVFPGLLIESPEDSMSVRTLHTKYADTQQAIGTEIFTLERDESEGTRQIFALAGPVFDTIQSGKILIFDEFGSSLHPLICRSIVELFNSKETNPNNAQLILVTHDTNLLSDNLFRRDQIWFTEKDRFGATDLYSLVEYKETENFSEKDYIRGKYGAIPFIRQARSVIDYDG